MRPDRNAACCTRPRARNTPPTSPSRAVCSGAAWWRAMPGRQPRPRWKAWRSAPMTARRSPGAPAWRRALACGCCSDRWWRPGSRRCWDGRHRAAARRLAADGGAARAWHGLL